MELYIEILSRVLAQEDIHITFPNLQVDATRIIESTCYKALKEIKEILEDDTLADYECFFKIEKIINTFEDLGSSCYFRHDF